MQTQRYKYYWHQIRNGARVLFSLTADRKPRNSITNDVTIGGVFVYFVLKDFKICHFQPYHDKETKKVRLYAVREK